MTYDVTEEKYEFLDYVSKKESTTILKNTINEYLMTFLKSKIKVSTLSELEEKIDDVIAKKTG